MLKNLAYLITLTIFVAVGFMAITIDRSSEPQQDQRNLPLTPVDPDSIVEDIFHNELGKKINPED